MSEEEKPSVPTRSATRASLVGMSGVSIAVNYLLLRIVGPEIGSTNPCYYEWKAFLLHMVFAALLFLFGIVLVILRLRAKEKAKGCADFCDPVGVALMKTNAFLFCVLLFSFVLTYSSAFPIECIPGLNLLPMCLLHVGGFLIGLVVTMVGLLRHSRGG
jgi:hypothetical protein